MYPAACNFCPYDQLDRKGVKMTDHLLYKIIEDLKEIPASLPISISPFKVNEPLLDSRLFPLLSRFEVELPNAQIQLTTNGVPLNTQKLDELCKLNNINYINVLFNDHRPDEYTKTMRLPYERTLRKLHLLHAYH